MVPPVSVNITTAEAGDAQAARTAKDNIAKTLSILILLFNFIVSSQRVEGRKELVPGIHKKRANQVNPAFGAADDG
jgi:hypothetical protein